MIAAKTATTIHGAAWTKVTQSSVLLIPLKTHDQLLTDTPFRAIVWFPLMDGFGTCGDPSGWPPW